MAVSYLKLGRNAEATSAAEKAPELTDRASAVLSFWGYVYAAAGERTKAIAVFKVLNSKYALNKGIGQDVAAVYAGLGEKDRAFEWLEKDFQARNGKLAEIRWRTSFEPLRDDPRYKDLLKRMNLPE